MKLNDTIANVVAGLMTGKDKVTFDRWTIVDVDREQADAAYRGDWIARKVIDIPPQDMCRAWRDWQAEGDQIERIEAEEARHNLRAKVLKGLRLARLYGGAGLYMGIAGDDPAQPLIPERIGRGKLAYVHVLHRWQLTANDLDRDPLSPFFGEPLVYTLASTQSGAAQIHPSRVVRLIGNELPDIDLAIDGWGESVLQSIADAIRHAGLTAGNIASLVHEAKIDVIKLPGLMHLAGDAASREQLLRRFTLASVAKANNGMLLLDGEEEWDRKTMQFSQLPEILTIYLQLAAGAADIPVTRLLGQSPAGMNSTGEHDTRNYYDRISADQEMILRPALERLDEVLIRSALGTRPPEVHYAWAPLWQLSETERADVDLKRSQTARQYLDTGLIPDRALARAVQNRLVEDGTYPGLEAALEEFGDEPIDREAERMQLEAELRAQGQGGREERVADQYNPDQPRAPAGSPEGGQWVSGNSVVIGTEPTDAERQAVHRYSEELYRQINMALRQNKPMSPELAAIAAHLDRLLERSTITSDTTLYRGMNGFILAKWAQEQGQPLKKGAILTDVGFMSTSTEFAVAKRFADQYNKPVIVEIKVKKGAKGLDISKISDAPGERETLFARGYGLKVVKYDEKAKRMVVEMSSEMPKQTPIRIADAAPANVSDARALSAEQRFGERLVWNVGELLIENPAEGEDIDLSSLLEDEPAK